jgi:hypothetical protein
LRSSSATARASSAAENPFSTRAKLNSTRVWIPYVPSVANTCRCAAIAAAVQARSWESLARPPA